MARTSYLDALGNVIQSSTPAGNWTINTYDGQARLIRNQLPEGNATEYTYDDGACSYPLFRCTHNVKSITSIAKPGSGLAQRVQYFNYEPGFNHLAGATDARGQRTTYAYTAQGLPLSRTRRRGRGSGTPASSLSANWPVPLQGALLLANPRPLPADRSHRLQGRRQPVCLCGQQPGEPDGPLRADRP